MGYQELRCGLQQMQGIPTYDKLLDQYSLTLATFMVNVCQLRIPQLKSTHLKIAKAEKH